MSYTVAAALGVAGALVLDLVLLRTRLVAGITFWATYVIVFVAQLIANGILTGRRVVRYDPHAIIGWHLVYAPVEDLAFGFALVLTSLSLWVRLGRRAGGPGAGGPRGGAATGGRTAGTTGSATDLAGRPSAGARPPAVRRGGGRADRAVLHQGIEIRSGTRLESFVWRLVFPR